ncbi:protein ORF59 [Cyprinid herpesvirus 1]|uniref:Protein ORF59 n=1 Tax=Cyprinid herpesvirus 1 TaxID=317858 RepID=K7PBW7_9VIRU|nr:protein ORF59 [Cyprinid herpesvirus 1]AFJ20358.1 protein ORF59 [Cyprinid herpesvirus 1]
MSTSIQTSTNTGDVWGAPLIVAVVALTLSAVTFILVILSIALQKYQHCEPCKSAKKKLKADMTLVPVDDLGTPDYPDAPPAYYTLNKLSGRGGLTAAPSTRAGS